MTSRSACILAKFVVSVGNIQTGFPVAGRFSLIELISVIIEFGADDVIILSRLPIAKSNG